MSKGRKPDEGFVLENIREEVVVDGRGESYILPSRLRVADCSICKRLVTKDRDKVPVYIRKFIGYIGGWKRQYEEHFRPLCLRCWNASLEPKQ